MPKPPPSSIPQDKVPSNVTQTQLVQIIGFSVVSINKWRTYYDDFPGPDPKTKLYNVKKVQKWLSEHPDVGQAGQKINGRREDLMCDNLEKRNLLLDRDIEESRYRLVDIDRVLAAIATERAIAVESFRRRMLSELPSELEGKSAREISGSLDDAFNLFLQDVQDSIPRIVKSTHI